MNLILFFFYYLSGKSMLGLSDEGEDNESSPIISSILSPTEDGPPTVPIGGK